jgi:hypothetical protein
LLIWIPLTDFPLYLITSSTKTTRAAHVKESNHHPEELWNQLDHPCYHNETFKMDSNCTFQLKGLCYSFDVNEDPITYEEAIVDPSGRMPCSMNTMNNNK